ncbi:hypothetical protein [Embleya sp. NPDC005971]|uniref:hypothetical protein n=1 Tax=Embleya sp. NPDC005971 TaxID=3156724 RepID=UPI0033D6E6E6
MTKGGIMRRSATASASIKYPDVLSVPTADTTPELERLRNVSAGLRDDVTLLGQEVETLHRGAQGESLQDRAAQKSHEMTLEQMLTELSDSIGLGWSEISEAVGVSPSAVRKWRRGGEATPDKRMAVAKLLGLLDLLAEACVAEPGAFFISPVVPDATVSVMQLFKLGRDELILDLAYRRKLPTQVLDEYAPDWRSRYAREYEVYEDSDGIRSLRPRTS